MQALKDAKENRGVTIQIVMGDEREYEAEKVKRYGLEVKLKPGRGYMHHKFIIFDKRLVMTGSYNFSDRAENRNDENVLIVSDPSVIKKYQEQFEKLWKEASPPSKGD